MKSLLNALRVAISLLVVINLVALFCENLQIEGVIWLYLSAMIFSLGALFLIFFVEILFARHESKK